MFHAQLEVSMDIEMIVSDRYENLESRDPWPSDAHRYLT